MSFEYQQVRSGVETAYVRYSILRWLSKLLPIGIFLLAWQSVSGALVPTEVLPPITVIAGEIARLSTEPELHSNVGVTLFRGAAGITIAAVIAVPLGVVMGRNEPIQRIVEPVIALTYPVPKAPLIPLLVFWLGMGHVPRILLAMFGAILPILISSYNAASSIDEKLLWAGRMMNMSRRSEVYKIVIPASLPTILTGVRIGLIFSFIIVVASEMIMGGSGLGFMLNRFGQYGQYESLFGVVFWVLVLTTGLDRLYLLLSGYLLQWSDQGVGGV